MTPGILLLNKSKGIASTPALQKVRRLLGVNKAGHSGTLDPMATGMLPLFFEHATKTIEYMLHVDKTYRAKVQFGQATNTGDAAGEVIETSSTPALTQEKIEQTLDQFRGVIAQIPPMFSAIKHQGKPLYKLALDGVELILPSRNVTIYKLDLVDFTADTLTFEVVCSKGTYIRTLAEDIAKHLGTCGHLSALHRLYCAGFNGQSMVTFEVLVEMGEVERQSLILPVDAGLQHWPIVQISVQHEQLLLHGKGKALEPPLADGHYRLYQDTRLIALADIKSQQIVSRKFVVGE